ncbi:Cellulose synthase/poly-beta-1,6-N-acetylglucosamine synthase-like glycosyltransferase [Litorimonas haliclonae]
MEKRHAVSFSLRRANRRASFLVRGCLVGTLLALAAGFYLSPLGTSLKLFALIAWLSVGVAALRLFAVRYQKPARPRPEPTTDFPFYSVLVPIFNEDNMVRHLMNRLERLDYPRDNLEILIICEEIDPKTIRAVQLNLRPPFRLIITPKGAPQTKPRALNYALQFAKGDLVTIYDAEDKPHPQQLKSAWAAFLERPDWAALQAPLDYYNSGANWLTRQFTLEYAALFHVWIPFLAKLGAPFPLGGTSNHIRREALEACRGWDAHNVTEDADLSFRLAALGYKIGFLDCPTEEEAVANLKDWQKQRARWMKGFMQTWMVHMHRPLRPFSWAGVMRFLTLQLTLGYTLLCASVFTPVVVFALLYPVLHYIWDFTLPFSWPYLLALALSLGMGIFIGMVGAIRAGKPELLSSALLMPFYWILLFWPTVRALIEIWASPFHWHKTPHGVSPPRKNNPDDLSSAPAE